MSNIKCKIFDDSRNILETKDFNESNSSPTDTDTYTNSDYASKKSPKIFNGLMSQKIKETDNEKFDPASSLVERNFESVNLDPKQTLSTKELSIETKNDISIGHSYMNSYTPSFQIDVNDPRREQTFFVQDIPVHIEITGYEEEPSLVLLHTNVYTIHVTHNQNSWTIKRKYKHFIKLYEAFGLFKTKLNIRKAAAAHLTSSLAGPANSINNDITDGLNDKKFKSSDHFKLLFQSIAYDFAQAKSILEKFLQDVLDHKIFRNHYETLKFLEVSHLSFINDLGDKKKEGLVKKRSLSIKCFSSALNLSFFWDNCWLIIKDTFVAYLDARTGETRCVMLVDQKFNVSSGYQSTGEKYGLFIETLSKSIFVKCYNEKRAQEWRLAIMKMIEGSASCFKHHQRFKSFAPIREDSNVKWFVDGSDYMESIADSIESAEQEIFITGFFLSPEIYLKRPVVVGDKWRLDKLLQRKAEEGVKIYVLIYKEIEITLPINSAYSKRILSLSHKNIKVLRHPDHINEPNRLLTIMWAHHEKLVIIDQSVAYFGGIDLCYGRWDNHLHKLTDLGSVVGSGVSNQQTSPSLPVDSTSSLRNSKLTKKVFKPHSISVSSQESDKILISNRKDSIASDKRTIKPRTSDENNNSRLTVNSNLTTKKSNLNRLKAIRMLSSPSRTVECEESIFHDQQSQRNEILSRNFLIDNMTDYYNNFIKKDIKFEDFYEKDKVRKLNHDSDDESYSDSVSLDDKKENRFIDKWFKDHLKRSKSLELNSKSTMIKSKSNDFPMNFQPKEDMSNPFKILKESLNYKLKSNHQSLKIFQRDYKEMTIFNKLKKIKQFKEGLRRYALNKNQDSDSSFDNYYEDNDDAKNLDDFSSQKQLEGSSKLWIGKDYCNFIFKDLVKIHSPFKDSIDRKITPRMPWHDVAGCVSGPAARDIARHFIQRWNYIKNKKVRNDKTFVQLLPKAYKNYKIPRHILNNSSSCKVQTLRSVANWSAGISRTENSIHEAYCHLIRTAKHYIYIENQFFISMVNEGSMVRNEIAKCLFERIVHAHNNNENFKVYIFMPLIPGYAGEYGKSSGILLHTITHYNNTSINELIKKLGDTSIDALNYIFFFGLRTWSELNNNLITELIYVHSKLMIVDDRACIIGSANINDRSLLGNRDSEVALFIEDTQFTDGTINKTACKVGKFTSTLRLRLFREFLGEIPCDSSISCSAKSTSTSSSRKSSLDKAISDALIHNFQNQTPNSPNLSSNHAEKCLDLSDPCSDEFYKQVLLKYAAQNTKIYDTVFKVIPCDYVSTFDQLKEYNKLMGLNQTDIQKARSEMSKIKGYIVLYPYRFLNKQDLTPPLGAKEYLLPSRLWT